MSDSGIRVLRLPLGPRRYPLLAAALGLLALVATGCGVSGTDLSDSASDADIGKGRIQFERSCAQCPGVGGKGTARGPSFLDDIYAPSHHADGAFLLAVKNGARQHHWDFGDMPRLDGLSDDEVIRVVAYVRKLQRDAGID